MMKTPRSKRLLLTLSITAATGANQAFAFSNSPDIVDQGCASLGYPLVRVDEAHNCSSCHNSSQARSAYNSGDWEYFCPAPAEPTCTDADNDGYFAEGGTCGTAADFNDANASAYPGAPELCTDGIDNDGDGLVDASDSDAIGCPVNCTDMDGDGASPDGGACGPVDCNDSNAAIHPAAEELCTDGIDNNCNGNIDTADVNAVNCPITCTDADGDGASIEGGACGPMDCDDANPAVNPSALEVCDDGIDNNCDNRSDAADRVCQDNEDTGSDEPVRPWWRNRHRDDDDGPRLWRRNRPWNDHDDEDDDDIIDDDSHGEADTDENSNSTRNRRSIYGLRDRSDRRRGDD